jgi:hypothetical protein
VEVGCQVTGPETEGAALVRTFRVTATGSMTSRARSPITGGGLNATSAVGFG